MSSFITTAINKKSGEDVQVYCLDDYFGRHRYGYIIDDDSNVLTEQEFKKNYEIVRESDDER